MCKDCEELKNKLKKEIELRPKDVDLYIRKNPYEAIGIAAGIAGTLGLTLGYLIGKTR